LINELLRLPGAKIDKKPVDSTGRSTDNPGLATGGILDPAGWSVVGERGMEVVGPGGSVYSHEQSMALQRMASVTHNLLGQSIVIPMNKNGKGNEQTINVYVGNEKLATFVIDTINKELRA
jgi:hypothetical protein